MNADNRGRSTASSSPLSIVFHFLARFLMSDLRFSGLLFEKTRRLPTAFAAKRRESTEMQSAASCAVTVWVRDFGPITERMVDARRPEVWTSLGSTSGSVNQSLIVSTSMPSSISRLPKASLLGSVPRNMCMSASARSGELDT